MRKFCYLFYTCKACFVLLENTEPLWAYPVTSVYYSSNLEDKTMLSIYVRRSILTG